MMKISNTLKGYLFASIAIIAVANVYLFSKAALNEPTLAQFGSYWFAFGLLWNLLFVWQRKLLPQLMKFSRRQYITLFILGLLEIAGTGFFFLAINTVSNPAVVSFIGNINPVLVTILGFLILQERFNKPELIGMLLAILGAFIISYQPNTDLNSLFIDGAGYVLFSGIFFATSTIIVKKNVKNIGSPILAFSRTFHLLVFSIAALLIMKDPLSISSEAFKNIIIGSLMGPFLTIVAGYQALKYLEASRMSLLGSSKGVLVMGGAYLYFGTLPMNYQILGGLLSISGVLLISMGRLMLSRRKKKAFNK